MLEHYKKIPNHKIKKLQELNKAILKVWINAKPADSFSVNLFTDKKFKELILSEKTKPKNDTLYKPIKVIFDRVKINRAAQDELKKAFNINNRIKALCDNRYQHPIEYKEFKKHNIDRQLKIFYEKFYNVVFARPKFKELFKTDLAEYYFDLKEERELTVCPFCGLKPLKSRTETRREAFDHYFAKAVYPFNSVNPDNLIPMCSDCNSGYKSTKELIYKRKKKVDVNRVKAFFPFDESIKFEGYTIKMKLNKKPVNFRKLKETDFELIIEFPGKEEEIERWKKIFGIEKRFKGQIIDNVKIWHDIAKVDFETDLVKKIGHLKTTQPLSSSRFLKYSLFDCWNREGSLSVSP